MKNGIYKDTFREIKKSFGRFLSIFAIVAIGVSFFAGVKAGKPVMKQSADKYFDESNFMDIRLIAPFNLTDSDIDAIREVEGIEGVYPSKSVDILTDVNSTQLVLRVHSLPENSLDNNNDYINRLTLLDGRLPQNPGECVIGSGSFNATEINVGDKLKISSGTSDDIKDTLVSDEYEVVGVVLSPDYLSNTMGTSDVGHGTINNFIVVGEKDFKEEKYSQALITVSGAKELNSYDEEYFKVIDKVTSSLETLSDERSSVGFEDFLKESRTELEKGKQEYEENKEKYEKELRDSEDKLQQGKIELIIGERELKKEEEAFPSKIEEGNKQLLAAEEKLKAGELEYNEGLKQFNELKESSEPTLKELETYLNSKKVEVDTLRKEVHDLKSKLEDPNLSIEEKLIIESEIKTKERTISSYDLGVKALEEGRKQISDAEKKLTEAKAEIDKGHVEIASQRENLKKIEDDGLKAFDTAKREIEKGKEEIRKGEEELIKGKELFQEELSLAKEKLDKAEKDLDEAKAPGWFILDRESHYGYMEYGSAADKIGDISNVFPVFFFLVAALVCLTTMTRMVDEQRGTIGTLKALGYSKMNIAFKYLVYAATASILGSIVGLTIGLILFPTVIFNAWGIMYTIPKVQLIFDVPLCVLTTLVAVLITTSAAMLACYKELMETPSLLMRPKAPKEGKRIILERMTFIWKRMNFTEKVTARNILRYKKRFFMTVIGISGCTALLVAGFGIKDSLSTIAVKQFEQIIKYDGQILIDSDISVMEKDELKNKYLNDSRVNGITEVGSFSIEASKDSKSATVNLVVPKNLNEYKDFLLLRGRKSQKEYDLNDSGVILSEKLANDLKVKKGDTIIINGKSVVVDNICEMYVEHYIFMSPQLYKSTFDVSVDVNSFYIKVKDNTEVGEEALASDIMEEENVKSVYFYSGIVENFDNTISSLNIVVLVLIVSAGALAFVVLYNLTNVNISERLREIATIKVLGFYDKEVSAYVYRENLVLTAVGALVGLGLGTILHRFIMVTVEFDNIMFGRNINFISYFLAVAITMIFSILVNLVMYKKLKNIPMVESLKSVE